MDKKIISALNESELCSAMIFDDIYATEDLSERFKLLAAVLERAKKLKISEEVEKVIAIYEQAEKDRKNALKLDCNSNNKVKSIASNFLKIIESDYTVSGKIIYNEFKNIVEYKDDDTVRQWTDSDDSRLKIHIEKEYGISNKDKYNDAMRVYVSEHSYNPLREFIDSLIWDGKERIESFLPTWTKCGDTPYYREASRLLFAGGIARLYSPGCKQEDIIVLIGKQGAGKTTIVRWLALDEKYYDDISEFKDESTAQKIQGVWVCELGELAAIKKARDQETVKAFISRQNDRYRAPYDKHVTDHPRQTFFIATANTRFFLNDESGGRRFYPVVCNCNATFLYSHEETIKEYIRQCWAEAREKYLKGELKPFPNPQLMSVIEAVQDGSVEEYWMDSAVRSYVEEKAITCLMEVWHEGLGNPEWVKPKRNESNALAQILEHTGEWERETYDRKHRTYGMVRFWKRTCWNTNDDRLNEIFNAMEV